MYLAAVATMALSGPAIAEGGAPRTLAEAERAVTVASGAFSATQLAKDRAGMDRFLAADFRFVRGSGKLSGRDDFIAGVSHPAVSFKPLTIPAGSSCRWASPAGSSAARA